MEIYGKSYLKANIPASQEEYDSGNGEGCWFIAEADAKRAYDQDAETGVYRCILDNDSDYYPGLNHGEVLPVEMRGTNRPVVPYSYLVEHYGKPSV